jgi:hypothetical protein
MSLVIGLAEMFLVSARYLSLVAFDAHTNTLMSLAKPIELSVPWALSAL